MGYFDLAEEPLALSGAALKTELRGRVQYSQESVLRRLKIDAISQSFCASCVASIQKDDHISRMATRVHSDLADIEQTKIVGKYMHSPLCAVLNHIARFLPPQSAGHIREFQFVGRGSKSTPRQDLEPSPAISMLDISKHSTRESAIPPILGDIAFVEVGASEPQAMKQAECRARRHLSNAPFQLFIVGLLIYGNRFCVAIYDRHGVTLSPESSLDIEEGWRNFIRIVRCMAVIMSPHDLGLDPTVERVLSADGTSWKYVISDRTGPQNRLWVVVSTVSSPMSLVGRGTFECIVQQLKDKDGFETASGNRIIMKTSWRNSACLSEATLYKMLQGRQVCHPSIADFLGGGDVCSPQGSPDSPICISALRATGSSFSLADQDKTLHRIFEHAGRPIWEYETEEELILGLKAAISGHEFLSQQGILHRSVLASNVRLSINATPGHEAFITDLSCARLVENAETAVASTAAVHTTPPEINQFTSFRILQSHLFNQQPPDHEPRDDLESFLWVFCYAIHRKVTTLNPENMDFSYSFRSCFGRPYVRDVARTRRSKDPVIDIGYYRGHVNGVSDALGRWCIKGGFDSVPFTYSEGFEFSYENIYVMFDDVLSAIRDGSAP